MSVALPWGPIYTSAADLRGQTVAHQLIRPRLRERVVSRATGVRRDLADGTEVIRDVHAFADHRAQLHRRDVARGAEYLEPSTCFVGQSGSDLSPLCIVHRRRLPGLIPLRTGERFTAVGRPAVHEREPVPDVLCVRGD